jgi:LPS-assembly protein
VNSIPRNRIGLLLACALLATASQTAEAAEPGNLPPIKCPGPVVGRMLPPTPDRSGAPVVMFARYLDASREDAGEAKEHVEVFRADQHLTTERIIYNPITEVLTFPEPVSYEDQSLWIKGQEAAYSFLDEQGRFSVIDYGLTGSTANGKADLIELAGNHTSRLYGLVYSTCPPEKPDWFLSAKKMELRHDEGLGIARSATLRFKGVPILYAPWFTFPIDDRRKTGFLYPSLSNTNDNGIEFGIPWYWNIAPNQDATLEPRYFSNRGFMLSGEYRLLTRHTNANVEFDFIANDRKTDDERYHYRIEHRARPWARWRTSLVFDRVSDNQYFQDYSSSLVQSSLQYLYSNATLSGEGRNWSVDMLVDKFQVIDENVRPQNEPYRRLPRIAFWMDQAFGPRGLRFSTNSELVYFDRDAGTTGTRIDLFPNVYWEQYTHWGFIKPSVGYRFTSYDLDLAEPDADQNPSRGNAVVSFDSGLYFDRKNSNGSTQSLEPRLFYLYVPYEDQSDLPKFDTGEFTFGFSQLFNTNRFSGADRQGDANQIALAASTRNYDSHSGNVHWSLNVGQIFYLDSLRVQLTGEPEKSLDLSPFIAEFNWQPFTRFSARTGAQWNWEENLLDVASFGVSYAGKTGQRASFDYRFRRDRVDQFDLRVFWPVNERWRVLSRVNYSFAETDLLEVQAGVEYESCCWAIRTVVRRYLKNRDGDYRDGIFLELNLKGLASIGSRAQELFNY